MLDFRSTVKPATDSIAIQDVGSCDLAGLFARFPEGRPLAGTKRDFIIHLCMHFAVRIDLGVSPSHRLRRL